MLLLVLCKQEMQHCCNFTESSMFMWLFASYLFFTEYISVEISALHSLSIYFDGDLKQVQCHAVALRQTQ